MTDGQAEGAGNDQLTANDAVKLAKGVEGVTRLAAGEIDPSSIGDALQAVEPVKKTTKKTLKALSIGCLAQIFILMFVIVVIIHLSNPSTSSGDTGIGGAASGTCMDIENGTALSSDEIDKLINSISAAKLLAGEGKSIYDAASKQKVNPLFMFSIAKHESNFGQVYANNPSSKFGAGKNMFGMDWSSRFTYAYKWEYGGTSGKHKVAYFRTWSDGLNENAALLRRSYLNPGGTYYKRIQSYVSKGEDLTEAVLEVYSPYSDGNNPAKYSAAVRKSMKDWCTSLGINPDQARSS